jgi:hypothetical protein
MLVDQAGYLVTAREYPPLVLVTPQTSGPRIEATAPGMIRLRATAEVGVPLVQVQVWDSLVLATPVPAADSWFGEYLGVPVRLVYLDDPTRRPVNPAYSQPTDRVSFADGYPLLLTSEASLAQLNEWIAAGPLADEGPLPMMRFRPSVVIAGDGPAFDEDAWQVIRIGSVVYRAPKGSDRCVLTMIDPDSAAKGKEPIATLSRYRKREGKVWFGVNLIPDAPVPGDAIKAGDEVEVLQRS